MTTVYVYSANDDYDPNSSLGVCTPEGMKAVCDKLRHAWEKKHEKDDVFEAVWNLKPSSYVATILEYDVRYKHRYMPRVVFAPLLGPHGENIVSPPQEQVISRRDGWQFIPYELDGEPE